MSVSQSTTITVTNSQGTSVSGICTDVGQEAIQVNQSFVANSADVLLSLAFPITNLSSIALLSTVAMTLKTNSSTSPGQTISLAANVPYTWSRGIGYFSNPITVAVTAVYVSCTTAGTLTGLILTN